MALLGTVALNPNVRLTKWTVAPDSAGTKVDIDTEYYWYDGTAPVLRNDHKASLLPDNSDETNDTVVTAINADYDAYYA